MKYDFNNAQERLQECEKVMELAFKMSIALLLLLFPPSLSLSLSLSLSRSSIMIFSLLLVRMNSWTQLNR